MEPPEQARRRPLDGLGFGVGFLCLLTSVFWLFNAHGVQSLVARYSASGVTAKATVTGKESRRERKEKGRTTAERSINVMLLPSGDTRPAPRGFTSIDERVTASVFEKVSVGDTVEVVYLPGEPKSPVLLRASLEPGHSALFDGYLGGGVLALLGLLGVGIGARRRLGAAGEA